MTEAEWMACNDRKTMLDHFSGKGDDRKPSGRVAQRIGPYHIVRSPYSFPLPSRTHTASQRKLHLFTCACCRHLWTMMSDHGSQFLEAMEDLAAVEDDAQRPVLLRVLSGQVARAAEDNVSDLGWLGFGYRVASKEGMAAAHEVIRDSDWLDTPRLKETVAADLLRDIFGPLPFRPVSLAPAWLGWKDRTAPKLAQAIYDERAFDRLPILADALEEAGCADVEVLSHLRGPGPHVRGCWAVDVCRFTA